MGKLETNQRIWAFRKNQGKGINIAVVDFGCDDMRNNPEFAGVDIPVLEAVLPKTKALFPEHGTQVASMIFAKNIGISRSASLYCFNYESIGTVKKLENIYTALTQRPRTERWIINLSLDSIPGVHTPLVKLLNMENVVVVVSLGNDPFTPSITSWYPTTPLPANLVTVAQYDIHNRLISEHNGQMNFASVYAPGTVYDLS
jgi:subtilisin family serine protease